MQASGEFGGLVVPLYRSNIDTDQIIPKQFLKSIERTGFGKNLFFDWRFDPDGMPIADFVLNLPRYQGARVLLAGPNFGCGSSREHAAWAIAEFGIKAIIAPSFADIFYGNAVKSGILPIVIPEEHLEVLVQRCETNGGYEITIDLKRRSIQDRLGFDARFHIEYHDREMLLNGTDEIAVTLMREAEIGSHERGRSYEALLTSR